MIKYYRVITFGLLLLILSVVLLPEKGFCQERAVKVLVASPYITENIYSQVADVMAGSIARELLISDGPEIINREMAKKYIQEQGGEGGIATREQAIETGKALGADVVIYSTLQKSYEIFTYRIALLEVERGIIQRILKGEFRISSSASEIGRIMKKDMIELIRYIPLSSEISDPGVIIRDITIDPDNLPGSHKIEDFPNMTRYGLIETLFTYYRVFPGELEYQNFTDTTRAQRSGFSNVVDDELTKLFNLYSSYGDFALSNNLQAYFIKDCSTMAVNVLLANNIPVFYGDDLLLAYQNLSPGGYCWFQTLSSFVFDTTDMSHRDRMVVLIIVPKPGRKGGIPKEYLETAIGRYKDEWGMTPTLVGVKQGFFDVGTGLLD